MHRRAGTHKRAAWSLDPGSAAHHAAGAARCAASGERKHASAPLAARCARVMNKFFAPKRAWGMPGARCTRSRACRVVSTRVSHHGRTGTPGIPARDGFNGVLRALPGDRALLSPSSPRSLLLENLTPTIERQDHTTSPSARVRSRQQRNSRPSHPNLTFVTIAKRPSVWAGMAADGEVIWVKRKPEYFCEGGLDK
jgi:hypothetical protein